MSLREYMYIDEKRLNSYEEQIGPPVTFDKVPVWKLMFGLAGPSVEGQQQRPGRPRTKPEKIELLLQYLEKHKQLAQGNEWSVNPFLLSKCQAVKVILPTKSDKLVLWLSEIHVVNKHDVQLLLLQDDGRSVDIDASDTTPLTSLRTL